MAGRARPSLVDFAFGNQLIESVQARAGGAVEMHFAEDCGLVAGLFQLLRQRSSCRVQRSEERRYPAECGIWPVKNDWRDAVQTGALQ